MHRAREAYYICVMHHCLTSNVRGKNLIDEGRAAHHNSARHSDETIEFSEQEIVCLYTLLCAPMHLDAQYWDLKEKIGAYLRKGRSMREMMDMQAKAQEILNDSGRDASTTVPPQAPLGKAALEVTPEIARKLSRKLFSGGNK